MKSIALRLAGATVSALAMPTPATNNNSSGANLTFTGPSHFLTPCERNAGRFRSTRKQLVREQSSHVLRVQKTLEDANIKLDSVLADLMGKSGRAMIEALIAGETNPAKLASLADRRVKASAEEFRDALRGRVTKHHRFLLRLHLNQIDALDAAMATIDAQVEENLGPFRTAVEQIISIPGVKNLGAHVIVSEIGIDMSRFPSAAHLLSWACICPGNDESAGKRRSNRMRKGAPATSPKASIHPSLSVAGTQRGTLCD
jgi:transposase